MTAARAVMKTTRESSFSRTQVETFPAFSASQSNAGPSFFLSGGKNSRTSTPCFVQRHYTKPSHSVHPRPRLSRRLPLVFLISVHLGPKQPDNVVLLTAPDLYLYATLVESGPFTRGSAPVEMWTQYYSAARQKVEANERRARFTANLAMRPMRNI